MKNYKLRYKNEAPFGNENIRMYHKDIGKCPDDGWESRSLPLGNGYMGINIFGRVECERLQITENSLCNPYAKNEKHPGGAAGLSNFCDIYIDFSHKNAQEYKRELNLNTAICTTEYLYNGVRYKREHFASYPDKVFVTHICADKKGALSFVVRAEVSHNRPYLYEDGDGLGRSAHISVADGVITLNGKMDYYGILYEGQISVSPQAWQKCFCKVTKDICTSSLPYRMNGKTANSEDLPQEAVLWFRQNGKTKSSPESK